MCTRSGLRDNGRMAEERWDMMNFVSVLVEDENVDAKC